MVFQVVHIQLRESVLSRLHPTQSHSIFDSPDPCRLVLINLGLYPEWEEVTPSPRQEESSLPVQMALQSSPHEIFYRV